MIDLWVINGFTLHVHDFPSNQISFKVSLCLFLGDLAPHLGRPLVGVFLQGTKDADQSVRASSLSNLGELCQRMNYALGPLAQEVTSHSWLLMCNDTVLIHYCCTNLLLLFLCHQKMFFIFKKIYPTCA